jgi:quinohemoprotein ethanol dehydrogenase
MISSFLKTPFWSHCLLVTFVFTAAALSDTPDDEAPLRPAGGVTQERVLVESADGANWLVNGGRFTGEHYSPLADINSSNVQHLGLAWFADIPSFTLAAEPIVVDGVIYLSGSLDRVFALDALTGEMLWQYDPRTRLDISPGSSYAARVSRGVAVWEGKVYAGTGDCRLVALTAATGEQLWETSVCDPTEGWGRGITAAPRVGAGMVFVGHTGSDFAARGSVAAFDADNGRELWRFWTVPGDPATGPLESKALEMAAKTWVRDGYARDGGGAVWEEVRYDPISGLVIFGTAGAAPMNTSLRGPGDQLFTSCVVAVDARTGEYRWHYQTVPGDAWDYDAVMPKIITELDLGGVRRRVVLEAPKNGFFYLLDAATGELLSADPIVRVNWASHIDLATGRPVEIDGARYYNNENPEEPVEVWPAAIGARNWQPMSYSPQLGLVYLPVVDMPATFAAGGGFFGSRTEILGYGPEEKVPSGAGRLIAWDPVRREERWSVDHAYPVNGGVLSTAGGLVFQGLADGTFAAYAAETGRLRWQSQTGSPVQAAPVSYRLAGEQYVLAAAGRAGATGIGMRLRAQSLDATGPARLFAFKLGGKGTMPAVATKLARVPRPPERSADRELVRRGAEVWQDAGCELCHGAHAIGTFERSFGDGAIPDLRYAPEETHAEWHAIVLGGSRVHKGMPAFYDSIGPLESTALHAWVVEQAWKLYLAQQGELTP